MQPELPLWQDPSGVEGPPPSPGSFIEQELSKRGWGQADLAAITGRPLPTINEIINAKRGITSEMAVALGRAFNTSPALWAHREAAYRLSLVNHKDEDTALKSHIYDIAPVKEMQKRGWLKPTDSAQDLERQLSGFFGVDSLDEDFQVKALARKSFRLESFSKVQSAWLRQASRLASMLNVRQFSLDGLKDGLTELRQLAQTPGRARHVPRVLAELGIRFVIVEQLPKSRIDGAAFYLDDDLSQPVIVLSLRYDRMDCFWHTLAHEIRHIYNGDSGSMDTDIVGEFKVEAVNEIEERADREAAEWLVPSASLSSFITRVKPYFAKERILQFSRRMGVHPSIVVGQLQHRKAVGWKQHRDLLEKVTEHITSTAMTDGFGKAPINFSNPL